GYGAEPARARHACGSCRSPPPRGGGCRTPRRAPAPRPAAERAAPRWTASSARRPPGPARSSRRPPRPARSSRGDPPSRLLRRLFLVGLAAVTGRLTGRGRRRGLLVGLRVDGLRERLRRLLQCLGLRADLADVVRLECLAQLHDATLDRAGVAGVELVAVLTERLLGLVGELLR